ncbi:MAG: hypothetical protein EOP88_05975 [Verrucomicrobiaceae bacterium]|nr:MAG: hypothetical protein EOP88_05975 [Verrucomicrobiaceae bacterium]
MHTRLSLALLTAAGIGSSHAAVIYSQSFDTFDDALTSSVYFDADPTYDGIADPVLTGADLGANSNLNGKLSQQQSSLFPQGGTYFLFSNTLGTLPVAEVWGTNSSQVIPVVAGGLYQFSFYLAAVGTGNAAVISPRINGVTLNGVTVDGQTNPGNATYSTAFTWVKHTYRWQAPTTGFADLSLVNFTTTDVGNDFGIDSITFENIPEPSAALLGALGVLGLMRRRR